MQKWEYAEVEVTIGGPLSGTHAEVYIYRYDEKHEEKAGPLGKTLAYMGNNGWEMVAASARTESGLTNKHKINYIFKRPKSE